MCEETEHNIVFELRIIKLGNIFSTNTILSTKSFFSFLFKMHACVIKATHSRVEVISKQNRSEFRCDLLVSSCLVHTRTQDRTPFLIEREDLINITYSSVAESSMNDNCMMPSATDNTYCSLSIRNWKESEFYLYSALYKINFLKVALHDNYLLGQILISVSTANMCGFKFQHPYFFCCCFFP